MRRLAVDREQIAGPDLEARPDDGAGIPFESSVVKHARAIYTRRVHRYSDQTEALGDAILAYSADRLKLDPVPLDGPQTLAELDAPAGADHHRGRHRRRARRSSCSTTCSRRRASRPTTRATCPSSRPRRPRRPTLFDLVVGASSIYGGSWLEGAGAVYAENQALRWIADLVGLPAEAGGVFVPGGTLGNLSALVAARHAARDRAPSRRLTGRRAGRVVAQRRGALLDRARRAR